LKSFDLNHNATYARPIIIGTYIRGPTVVATSRKSLRHSNTGTCKYWQSFEVEPVNCYCRPRYDTLKILLTHAWYLGSFHNLKLSIMDKIWIEIEMSY